MLPLSATRWIGFIAEAKQSEQDRIAGVPATPPSATLLVGAIYQLTPFVNILLLFAKGNTRLVSLEREETDNRDDASLETRSGNLPDGPEHHPMDAFDTPADARQRSGWRTPQDDVESHTEANASRL